MAKAVIVDIDGTIADTKHRLKYLEDKKDFAAFYAQAPYDTFRKDIWDKVLEEAVYEPPLGSAIVFITGRPEEYREPTERWLEENGISMDFVNLYMRPKDDMRQDDIVKGELFDTHVKPKDYEITAVFEDRPRVIRMWQERGFNVIDCGDGVEF